MVGQLGSFFLRFLRIKTVFLYWSFSNRHGLFKTGRIM